MSIAGMTAGVTTYQTPPPPEKDGVCLSCRYVPERFFFSLSHPVVHSSK